MQQFNDEEGYVVGWAIGADHFVNMVAHGMQHADFNFANQMWQAWHDGDFVGAWDNWYDDDEEEWDEEGEWDGYNVGATHTPAIEDDTGEYEFLADPDEWLVDHHLAAPVAEDDENPSCAWNWETLSAAATSVPETHLGDPTVITAASAASVAPTEADANQLPVVSEVDETMEVDSESTAVAAAKASASRPPTPQIPRRTYSERTGSYNSRLLYENQ